MGQSPSTTPSPSIPPRTILQSVPRSKLHQSIRSYSIVHRTASRKKNWKKASIRLEGVSPIRRLSRAVTGQRKDRALFGKLGSGSKAQAGPLLVSDSHGSLDESHETYKLAASRREPSTSSSKSSRRRCIEADVLTTLPISIHHLVQTLPPSLVPGSQDPETTRGTQSSRNGLQKRPSRSRSLKKVKRTRTKSKPTRRKVEVPSVEPLRIDKRSRRVHEDPFGGYISPRRPQSSYNNNSELPQASAIPLPSFDHLSSFDPITLDKTGRMPPVGYWTIPNLTRPSIDPADIGVPLCLTPGAGKSSTFPSSIHFVQPLLLHPRPLRVDPIPCPTGRRASTPRPAEYDPDYLDRCPAPRRMDWSIQPPGHARSSGTTSTDVESKLSSACESSIGSSLGSFDSQERLNDSSMTTVSSGGPIYSKDPNSFSTPIVLPLPTLLDLPQSTPEISPGTHWVLQEPTLCHRPSSTLDIHFLEFSLSSLRPSSLHSSPLPQPQSTTPLSPNLSFSPAIIAEARRMDFSIGSPSSLRVLTLPLFDFDHAGMRDRVSRPGDTRRRSQAVGVRRSSGREGMQMLPLPVRCNVECDEGRGRRGRKREKREGKGEKEEEAKRGLDRGEVSDWVRGLHV